MKIAMSLSVLAIAAFSRMAVAQPTTFVLPETGKSISLSFVRQQGSEETYDSFRIEEDTRIFDFEPKDPIIRIPAKAEQRRQQSVWVDVPGLTLNASRFFLSGQYRQGGAPHSLLFFVSQAYASNAAPLLVIAFFPDGTSYRAFERGFDLATFRQTLNGGSLIGKLTMSEAMGCVEGAKASAATAATYDPFSVFMIRPGAKAIYDLKASRTYNERHYIWAGPHSREDYAVFYNLPGRKKLIGAPASQIESLLGPCNP